MRRLGQIVWIEVDTFFFVTFLDDNNHSTTTAIIITIYRPTILVAVPYRLSPHSTAQHNADIFSHFPFFLETPCKSFSARQGRTSKIVLSTYHIIEKI